MVILMSVPKKCLIIDDEVGITFLTKKFPEIERYQTLTCSNGDDALTIIEENREEIELVMLNIMLHGLSGYKILEVIKYKYPSINIVLFSPPRTMYPWTKLLQCKNCGKYTEHNLTEEHGTFIRPDPWFYECTICGEKRRLHEKKSEVEKYIFNVNQKLEEDIFKVIVIGDPDTGKTEFLDRFAYSEDRYLDTVGVSIYKHAVTLGEHRKTYLMFWDISGQSQFNMLHRPYFSDADGIILVFDITRLSTFSNINNWWNSCVKYGLESIPRVLVGILKEKNSENERKILLSMANHLSTKLNAPYFESTLDKGENIDLILKSITKLILERKNKKH